MHISFKIISLSALVALQGISADEHYDVTMKLGESFALTLNSKQWTDDQSNPGNKVIFPHLWRLDGYDTQSIVHLNDETTGEHNTRVYDLKTGKWNVSVTDTTAKLLLLNVFGLFLITPYEQEYLFTATNVGHTTLTFLCEKRYCWEAPTKVATVNIHVTEDSGSKSHKLYIK